MCCYCRCRLYKEGNRGTQLCTRCECGDRIGCGIKFDQLSEERGDSFCPMVPVYFVRNGKEVSTEKFYELFLTYWCISF